jgi:hypothetical protein
MENTQVKAFVDVPDDGCELSEFDTIGVKTCAPVVVELDDEKGTLEADVYLAAMGRAPVAKGTSIGIEAAGIALAERGHIGVDVSFETSVKGIFVRQPRSPSAAHAISLILARVSRSPSAAHAISLILARVRLSERM